MFGNGLGEPNNPPDNNRYFTLESADLVIPRMEAWRLLWDFRTIRDLAKNLPENSPLGNLSMEVANKIMNVFKVDDFDTIKTCRKLAEKVSDFEKIGRISRNETKLIVLFRLLKKVFGTGWEALGADIYKGDPSNSATWAIGELDKKNN